MNPDAAPGLALPRIWRVATKAVETGDTVTLTLEPSAAAEPFRFEPGQFNMLYAFGRGEAAVSISGDPDEGGRLVHTVRAVGNVTRPIAALEPGEPIGVRGPFGRPWPLDSARGLTLLIVAGGLGLAPLRPALLRAMRERVAFRRVVVLVGARDPAGLVYRQELASWGAAGLAGTPARGAEVGGSARGAGAAPRDGIELHLTVDHADPAWRGEVGVILRPLRALRLAPAETVALVCGPEIMMRLVADELLARGVSTDRIHVSLERNMKCAVARCGHCQFGPHFLCSDGPVFRYDQVRPLMAVPQA